jgi:hypothetical protein
MTDFACAPGKISNVAIGNLAAQQGVPHERKLSSMALAEVQPGMVLSDVLLDMQGKVLLPQGTVLTEAMLALMPRHGIACCPSCRPNDAGSGRGHAAPPRGALARLFRKNDADSGSDWATAPCAVSSPTTAWCRGDAGT